MLTRKQSELLRFIHERLKESGVPPSFDEMKEALDLRSKSGIHRLILALEERGFIRRLPNRARALEVLRLPEFDDAFERRAARNSRLPSSRAISGACVRRARPPRTRTSGRSSPFPSWAGSQPARRSPRCRPAATRSPAARHAAARRTLRARSARRFDDRGRHIRRRHRRHPQAGHGRDRRHRGGPHRRRGSHVEAAAQEGTSIALEAANPAYETRIFGPDRVRIQGKLVSLIRKY